MAGKEENKRYRLSFQENWDHLVDHNWRVWFDICDRLHNPADYPESIRVKASLVLSAIDPKTGLSGGLLFGLWLIFSNLFNLGMEEGLFRGVMLRHFLVRYSKWGAIFLQAILFSLGI